MNTLWESLVSTLTSNGHWPHNYDIVNETLDLELLKELSAQGAGFALLIDDADELPLKDLEAVCTALHEATQDSLRVTSALSVFFFKQKTAYTQRATYLACQTCGSAILCRTSFLLSPDRS